MVEFEEKGMTAEQGTVKQEMKERRIPPMHFCSRVWYA
jgi:hypothetical protein